MKEIKTVSLIGAGAIGAVYAQKLFSFLGAKNFQIIVSPERKLRYEKEGIYLNGERMDFPYCTPKEAISPSDLIIIAVKYANLSEALLDIAPFVGENTTILSLLNGITSEEIIAESYGKEKLLYGFTAIDTRREGKNILCKIPGKIVFGEKDNHETERIFAVRRLFEASGIKNETPTAILHEMWWKFMFNIGVNTFSAILKINLGVYKTIPEAKALMLAAQREIMELSIKAGVNLDESDLLRILSALDSFSPDGEPSMWQDIEAKRKTEIDMLCGVAVELGKQYAIPTPVNSLLCNMIKTLEKMY